jgi:murein DD-endopeptidase
MREMPTLGPPPKKGPLGPLLIAAAVIGLLAGGLYWWRRAPVAPPTAQDGAQAVLAEPEPPKPPTPEETLAKAGLRRLSTAVDGPLESAIVAAAGAEVGAPLTQVVTRSLVWWVAVPGDLRRGDTLDVLYEVRAAEEPLVHAVRFTSGKAGKSFSAFRFHPPGAPFPRYFDAEGQEVELRLQDSPIDDYEQITSLLRDGRKHKGVDFKCPVGTPVKAPFDGTLTRKNWNFRANGNSLELTEGGKRAVFLHLAELPRDLKVGQRIRRGEVIAQSGNSGRSFAPHLHYQLMGGGDRVLDPFDVHKTYRRALPTTDRPAFAAEQARLLSLLVDPAPAVESPTAAAQP